MKKKKFKKTPKTEEQVYSTWAESGEVVNPKKKYYRSPKELKDDVVEIISSNGSTWIKKELFLTECDDTGITSENIKSLFEEDYLVEENDKEGIPYISTREIKEAEEEIARLIYWHCNVKVLRRFPLSRITELIKKYEEKENITLANEQRMAVIKAINAPICVITGVAGAGKTT
ncbi:MAG: hypothetical protein IK121_10635, partial [Lachnospiraceae bacterium]|nr:hypothetical protein [Lachnospiraceae bacterium]